MLFRSDNPTYSLSPTTTPTATPSQGSNLLGGQSEQTNQTNAGLVFGDLIAGQQPTGLVTSLSSYGLDTSEGGASWLMESVANVSTLGGQAIVSSMRESRNQVLLQDAGVQTDIIVDDEIVQYQSNNLSSGQYTASEAESNKII